jgi:hypothetical protein
MDPGWVTAGIAFATVVIGLVGWGFRWLWRTGQRVTHFMDDYFGEAARPGHKARLGSLERLENLENITENILHEVKLNSGQSIKDVVNRTEAAVTVMQGQIESIARQVQNLPGGNA